MTQPREEEWVRYWRSPDGRLEAMHARFRSHSYHRHSHETYSFGVTEAGAQSFTCRRQGHMSAAGMIMAFNPDDPHDGHASTREGFTYRMVHIEPATIGDVLAAASGRPPRLPLFVEPVLHDPLLAGSLRRLCAAISAGSALECDEQAAATVQALARRGSTRATRTLTEEGITTPATADIAGRVRVLLDDAVAADVAAEDLADAAGCSRYAVYRAFRARYGLAPSEYLRQLRLRTARRLLARGMRPAEVAAAAGFADQAHLTRWFVRWFGVTPGAYRRA